MHTYLGRYKAIPILTLCVAAIIYGPALWIIVSDPTDRGKEIASSIVIWAFSLLFSLVIYRWVYYVMSLDTVEASGEPLLQRKRLWALFDVFLATYHLLAALAFSIWLMDGSAGKDAYFIGISALDSPYSVYVGDFLMTTITLFNSAGFSALQPRPSTPLAAIWVIVVSLSGILFITLLLSFLLTRKSAQTSMPRDFAYAKSGAPYASKFKMPRYSQNARGIRPRIYTNKQK